MAGENKQNSVSGLPIRDNGGLGGVEKIFVLVNLNFNTIFFWYFVFVFIHLYASFSMLVKP